MGSGPLGSVPPATFSIWASWAGLGLGKPSGVGNLNGAATTPATAAERVIIEVKYIVRVVIQEILESGVKTAKMVFGEEREEEGNGGELAYSMSHSGGWCSRAGIIHLTTFSGFPFFDR